MLKNVKILSSQPVVQPVVFVTGSVLGFWCVFGIEK